MTKSARSRHCPTARIVPLLAIALTLVGLSLLATACTDIWGAWDNPADPTGTSYQGYETVKDADAIQVVSTSTNYSESSAVLTATKVADAGFYHFQVDTSDAFDSVELVFDNNSQTTNQCVATGLPRNTTLHWWVCANTPHGWGSWSEAVSFIIIPPPPLLTPIDGATVASARPEFTWEAVDGFASYELVLAQSEAELSGATPVSVSGTSWTPDSDLDKGSWYWQVCSVGTGNGAGDWSVARRFINPFPYTISDTGPAGGIVFYDKGSYSNGWRYLEAWTADEGGGWQWKTSNTLTGGTSTAIGSGYANTYTAMGGTAHPAAQAARNATHGGKTDWFLPSKDELNLMYGQKGVIGGFASDYYWSSSESSSYFAWLQVFVNGTQSGGYKAYSWRVRVVRAF